MNLSKGTFLKFYVFLRRSNFHDKQKETEIDRGEFAKESNIGKVVLKMLKRIGVI